MGVYRLEVWFNYPAGTIDWGMAQDTAGGNPPFSNGGTALAKNSSGVVTINGAGNNSTFDIYVFDVSGDGVARDLQWIRVDYERAAGNSSGGDPISSAGPLRAGMTGAQFSGTAGGFTSGVNQEDTIVSAPAGTTAQRRWSLDSGYVGLTPGRYTFDVDLVVTPANGGKVLAFDPEMDINP